MLKLNLFKINNKDTKIALLSVLRNEILPETTRRFCFGEGT